MGYKWQPGSSINGIKGILCKKGMGSFHLDVNQPFHAEYHSSWDWLMPVVEKIEDMSYDVNITGTHVIIVNSENGYEYDDMANSKIKAVWEAVVIFIQWYNNQKQ